jgi:hypothetical protein
MRRADTSELSPRATRQPARVFEQAWVCGSGQGAKRMRAGTRRWWWVVCDALIAVAAVLLLMAVRWPWYVATLATADLDLDPPDLPHGAATGLYAHTSLWVVVGVAAVQLVLLLARYSPGERLRVPDDDSLLLLGSGLCCLTVAVDAIRMPMPWAEIHDFAGIMGDVPMFAWQWGDLDKEYPGLAMTWSFGAAVAAAAAGVSLVAVLVSLRRPTKAALTAAMADQGR